MENILVFGGSGGIGMGIVNELKKKPKTRVLIIDLQEPIIEKKFDEAVEYIRCDLTNLHNLTKVYDYVASKFGQVHHIISLAGRALEVEFEGLEKMQFSDITKSININLITHINICKMFGSLMNDDSSSSITLISSINADLSLGLPAYSAGKAGLIGFAKSTAKFYGTRNTRINVISPGTVVTSATLSEPKDFDEHLEMTKLGRFTTVEEVGKTVEALIYSMTSVTGQNIVIDAGQSI